MFPLEILKHSQNTYFIVHLRTATSDLIEYLKPLTINYDSRKYLKIFTTVIYSIENIWKFDVAINLSENRI